MISMPELSFIIPFFNRYNLLINAMEKIFSADTRGFEIVLVDDASVDSGLENVTSYISDKPNVKYFRMDKNSGPGASKNAGISLVSGEWIFFHDSDDEIFPSELPKLIAFLKQLRDIDFVELNMKTLESWGYVFNKNFIKKNGIENLPLRTGGEIPLVAKSFAKTIPSRVVEYSGKFYNYFELQPLSVADNSVNDPDFASLRAQDMQVYFKEVNKIMTEEVFSNWGESSLKKITAFFRYYSIMIHPYGKAGVEKYCIEKDVRQVNDIMELCKTKNEVYIAPCNSVWQNNVKFVNDYDVNIAGILNYNNGDNTPQALEAKRCGYKIICFKDFLPPDNAVVLVFGNKCDFINSQLNDKIQIIETGIV